MERPPPPETPQYQANQTLPEGAIPPLGDGVACKQAWREASKGFCTAHTAVQGCLEAGVWTPTCGQLLGAPGKKAGVTCFPRLRLLPLQTLSPSSELRILLLCGSDLLESFCIPGLWNEADVSNEVPRHTRWRGGRAGGALDFDLWSSLSPS